MVDNEYFILTNVEGLKFSFEWRFVNKDDFDTELTEVLNNFADCSNFKIIGSVGEELGDCFFMNVIKDSCKVEVNGNDVFVRGMCKYDSLYLDDRLLMVHEHYGDDFLCEFWDLEDNMKGIHIYLGKYAIDKFSDKEY